MPPTQIIYYQQKRTSINLLAVTYLSACNRTVGHIIAISSSYQRQRERKSQQTDEKEQLEAIPCCGNLFNFMAQRTEDATDVLAKCNLKRASK